MTRPNETPRQEHERCRIDAIRPPWEALSDIERATLLLHRSDDIVHDDPKTCANRLRILALAIDPKGPR